MYACVCICLCVYMCRRVCIHVYIHITHIKFIYFCVVLRVNYLISISSNIKTSVSIIEIIVVACCCVCLHLWIDGGVLKGGCGPSLPGGGVAPGRVWRSAAPV